MENRPSPVLSLQWEKMSTLVQRSTKELEGGELTRKTLLRMSCFGSRKKGVSPEVLCVIYIYNIVISIFKTILILEEGKPDIFKCSFYL